MKYVFLVIISLFLYANSYGDEPKVQSKVYGSWSPPSVLLGFWNGINDNWWNPNHPQIEKLDEYFSTYARDHDARAILPAIIEDLKENWSELRMGLYSGLVLHFKRSEVKKILKQYSTSDDPTERKLAVNFIADIEEVEQNNGNKEK